MTSLIQTFSPHYGKKALDYGILRSGIQSRYALLLATSSHLIPGCTGSRRGRSWRRWSTSSRCSTPRSTTSTTTMPEPPPLAPNATQPHPNSPEGQSVSNISNMMLLNFPIPLSLNLTCSECYNLSKTSAQPASPSLGLDLGRDQGILKGQQISKRIHLPKRPRSSQAL